MHQLNQVYERMIHAMTVTMYGATPMAAAAAAQGAPVAPPPVPEQPDAPANSASTNI